MSSLYGIESEEDCRKRMDELLELHDRAKEAVENQDLPFAFRRQTITSLKSLLGAYFQKGKTTAGKGHMSPVESRTFWPAIREAYVSAPKLHSTRTWVRGLCEIESRLRYYRPKEDATQSPSLQ